MEDSGVRTRRNQVIFAVLYVTEQGALTVIKLLRFFCINCCFGTRFHFFCTTRHRLTQVSLTQNCACVQSTHHKSSVWLAGNGHYRYQRNGFAVAVLLRCHITTQISLQLYWALVFQAPKTAWLRIWYVMGMTMVTVFMKTARRLSDILPLKFLRNRFARSAFRRQHLLCLQCVVARQRPLIWQQVRNMCGGGTKWLP